MAEDRALATTCTVYGSIPNTPFTPKCCDTPTLDVDGPWVGKNGLAYASVGCSACSVDWLIITETAKSGRGSDDA